VLLTACLAFKGPPAKAVTFTEQIERLQLVYAALLDYRPGGPPRVFGRGQLALGLELVPIPPIDNRVGNKDEPVNPPPAYGRGRAIVGIGAGFAIGVAYLPPVPVANYRAQLAGLSIEYDWERGAFLAGARAFYQSASVRGPITDPSTSDQFTAANAGLDVRAGWAFPPWIVYGGAGAGETRSRLEVTSDGSVSNAAADYRYAFAGASRDFGAWRVALEQQQTEIYLQNVVLTVMYAF
jgi:hypothetical protein